MRKLVILWLLVTATALPLPAARAQGGAQATVAATGAVAMHGADLITPEGLKNFLYFIADDAMEGRDTPSRGLDTAANFIAFNLKRWGLKPAGDPGSYFQRIGLRRARVDPAQTHAELNGQAFKYGDDFLAGNNMGTAAGEVVYVGDGWLVKSKNLNPYRDLDIRDKIVVSFGGPRPKDVTAADLAGTPGVDYADPRQYAVEHGAKGMVVIPSDQIIARWDQVRRGPMATGAFTVEKPDQSQASLPTIIASKKMLEALFAGEQEDAAKILERRNKNDGGNSFALSPGKKLTLTVGGTVEKARTQNVVAVLEGADPVLKNEYVALGAHYDHVGMGQPLPGTGRGPGAPGSNDIIYNGADDDGSGTTALLAIAEALSREPRPKRSVLFVWHCGEEKGLWGSEYFTDNPTIPLRQIVTQLNIDMIGRSKKPGDTNPRNKELTGPNAIYVIGSKMMSSELSALAERVNRSYLNLEYDYRYDDPHDPNRFFFRSDHYNYARKGVPIIFFFDGEHEDYHRPSDEPDKIDYEKMAKVTRTIYLTMWELANAPRRPVVDKKIAA